MSKEGNIKKRIQLHNTLKGTLCGIGIRNTKLMLNPDIEKNPISKAYRLLLETEDCNIKAKSENKLSRLYYYKKRKLIRQLIGHCKENGYIFGYQDSDDTNEIKHIIYFDIPGCEQISFHNTFTDEELQSIPYYQEPWDEKECSTLLKIEDAIIQKYKDKIPEIQTRYKKYQEKITKKLENIADKSTNEEIYPYLADIAEIFKNNKSKVAICKYTPHGLFNSRKHNRCFNVVLTEDNQPILSSSHMDYNKIPKKYRNKQYSPIKISNIYTTKTDHLQSKKKTILNHEYKNYANTFSRADIINAFIELTKNIEDKKEFFIACTKHKNGIFLYKEPSVVFMPVVNEDLTFVTYETKPANSTCDYHALRLEYLKLIPENVTSYVKEQTSSFSKPKQVSHIVKNEYTVSHWNEICDFLAKEENKNIFIEMCRNNKNGKFITTQGAKFNIVLNNDFKPIIYTFKKQKGQLSHSKHRCKHISELLFSETKEPVNQYAKPF